MAKTVRFDIGSIFVELRGSKGAKNVFELRELPEGERQILIGLAAETFDSALTFYLSVIQSMIGSVASNIVEITGHGLARLIKDVGIKPESQLKNRAIFPQVNPALISRLLNSTWLGATPWIFGFNSESLRVNEFILERAHLDSLPEELEFVITKKSRGTSDFLIVLCKQDRSIELINFLRQRSTELCNPLIEARVQL